jgi:hypothetical protein
MGLTGPAANFSNSWPNRKSGLNWITWWCEKDVLNLTPRSRAEYRWNKWKVHAGLTGSYDELFDGLDIVNDGINWPCGQLLQSGINWITWWCEQDMLNLTPHPRAKYWRNKWKAHVGLTGSYASLNRVLAVPWSLSPISNNIWNRTGDWCGSSKCKTKDVLILHDMWIDSQLKYRGPLKYASTDMD